MESRFGQVTYNKINCTGCGESTIASLTAFDFGKVFAEVIRAESVHSESKWSMWDVLVNLDLKFYYTIRDLCQELEYRIDRNEPTELKLKVKDIVRQIEFLTGKQFSKFRSGNDKAMLYNSLFEQISFSSGSELEKKEELETFVKWLLDVEKQEDFVVASARVQIEFERDHAGNEMPVRVFYFIGDKKCELKERVCPMCGAPMDSQAGYRIERIIGLAGLSRVGKTAYIASLVHQLRKLDAQGLIHIKDNVSDSLAKFEEEIVSEYEKGNIIRKTEVENTEGIPLVYLPFEIQTKDGTKECNFIFVDMPGEIFSNADEEGLDYIENKRVIIKNADAIWCCIEPSMIDSIYRNKHSENKDMTAEKQLSGLIRVLGGRYTKIPAGIIVTQCDLLKNDYPLFKPEVDVMNEYVTDGALNWTKTEAYIEETRGFVDRMNNFRISVEDAFDGFSMFGVASYGFDVTGKSLVSSETIQPSMVELPFLWTLAKLGLIKAAELTQEKGLFGREKVISEEITDTKRLYMRQ